MRIVKAISNFIKLDKSDVTKLNAQNKPNIEEQFSKPANFKFNLGSEVEDILTGFKGIVTCRSQYLHNCNTYAVKPTGLKDDGDTKEASWFDEPQLKLTKSDVFEPYQKTGGPTDTPKRTNRF